MLLLSLSQREYFWSLYTWNWIYSRILGRKYLDGRHKKEGGLPPSRDSRSALGLRGFASPLAASSSDHVSRTLSSVSLRGSASHNGNTLPNFRVASVEWNAEKTCSRKLNKLGGRLTTTKLSERGYILVCGREQGRRPTVL